MRIASLGVILTFFTLQISFASAPVLPAAPVPAHPSISEWKIQDIQKILGRKLTWKEKISLKLYQRLSRHLSKVKSGGAQPGKTAMILGIIGIVVLFIPYVQILALPLGILALVLGYKARKANPSDRKAVVAIILGWIGLALFVVLIAFVLAWVSAFGGLFG